LGHQQSLLAKRRKQLRLPYTAMEIAGLAIADPVPIRLREREIKMVQRPSRWDMRWSCQQLEDLARLTTLQIKQGRPRRDPWFHRLRLYALDHQRLDGEPRLLQRAKVGRFGGNDPDRINTTSHDEIAEGPDLPKIVAMPQVRPSSVSHAAAGRLSPNPWPRGSDSA
jgi:hypothetical protein